MRPHLFDHMYAYRSMVMIPMYCRIKTGFHTKSTSTVLRYLGNENNEVYIHSVIMNTKSKKNKTNQNIKRIQISYDIKCYWCVPTHVQDDYLRGAAEYFSMYTWLTDHGFLRRSDATRVLHLVPVPLVVHKIWQEIKKQTRKK